MIVLWGCLRGAFMPPRVSKALTRGASHIREWQSHSPITQWSYKGAAHLRRQPHSPTSTIYTHLVAFNNNASPCNTIDFTGHYWHLDNLVTCKFEVVSLSLASLTVTKPQKTLAFNTAPGSIFPDPRPVHQVGAVIIV